MAAKNQKRRLLKKPALLKPQLLVFIITFGCIGAYILVHSFAYTTNSVALDGAESGTTGNGSFYGCGTQTATGIGNTVTNISKPTFNIAANGGAAVYEFFVDDVSQGIVEGDGQGTACATVPNSLSDGFHNFTANELQPHVGNHTTPNPFSFRVDTLPPGPPSTPTFSFFSGMPGTNYSNNLMFVGTYNTNDEDKNVLLQSCPGSAFLNGQNVLPPNGTYNVQAISSAAEGPYSVQAKVSDEAFNFSQSSGCTSFTYDRTAPTNAITYPTNGSTAAGTINVTSNESDNLSGIWRVEYYLNNTLGSGGIRMVKSLSAPPYSFSWNPSTATGINLGGSNTLTAIAYDQAGNKTINTVTFTAQSGGGGGPPNPADLNSDGVVDGSDLAVLLANFHTNFAGADIDKDGVVGVIDLSILLSNYGH